MWGGTCRVRCPATLASHLVRTACHTEACGCAAAERARHERARHICPRAAPAGRKSQGRERGKKLHHNILYTDAPAPLPTPPGDANCISHAHDTRPHGPRRDTVYTSHEPHLPMTHDPETCRAREAGGHADTCSDGATPKPSDARNGPEGRRQTKRYR